jgi:hypothetical protein
VQSFENNTRPYKGKQVHRHYTVDWWAHSCSIVDFCVFDLSFLFLKVIDSLDFMKKDSKEAREVVRWLEGQFKQGNR